MILETTFLVDLEREAHRREEGPATRVLDRLGERRLCIAVITAGELAAGPRVGARARWHAVVHRFEVLAPDLDVAWRYGQAHRYLRDNGVQIGANDLWIAATALAHDMPVLTRNGEDFARVPGLSVETY